MSQFVNDLDALVDRVASAGRLVAIAGAPASGKTTLATELAARIKGAVVVPMDGFHLDNRVLEPRGLLSRKGSPETFDLGGLKRTLAALKGGGEVVFPVFDRARDIAVAGAGVCSPDAAPVMVEGNYLLFDEPGWRDLAPFWDLSIRLDVPIDTLRDRLIQRWLDLGLDMDLATARAQDNDIPNAERIAGAKLPADLIYRSEQ